MSTYQPRIAIVGGGPGGLTIGLLLLKRGIPFTIFELRPKPSEEELNKPVGLLDLHEESGLAALKACDLMDVFEIYTGFFSENQVIANREGDIIHTDDGTAERRPEISRNSLTKILIDQIPHDNIRGQHKLTAATQTTTSCGTTETELDFGSNGKHAFDLVIGADGTWSRVRNLPTTTKPTCQGIQTITVTIREVDTKYPEIAKYLGAGSFTCLANRRGVMSQRALQNSARIYVFLSIADEKFGERSGFTSGTPTQAKERLLTDDVLLAKFGPIIKNLVSTACDEETNDNPGVNMQIMPLYHLPIGHTWDRKPGVAVIGDAAHVIGPFAGEGVNLAMWDGLDIAQTIIKAYDTMPKDAVSFQNTLDPLVEEFEGVMAQRAEEKAQETSDNHHMMFGGDEGSKAMAKWMTDAIAAATAMKEDVDTKVFSE